MTKDSTIWEEFPEDLEWRAIPDFENYEINNYGDIRNLLRDCYIYFLSGYIIKVNEHIWLLIYTRMDMEVKNINL